MMPEPKETDAAKTPPATPALPARPVKSTASAAPKLLALIGGADKKHVICPETGLPYIPPKLPSRPPSGSGDPWSGYIAKYGEAPSSAAQLQSFSKATPNMTSLNFKQARDMFNAKR